MMIDADAIAKAIETAPAWSMLALTAPSERLRQEGRREIGEHLYASLYRPIGEDAQLPLPL